MTFEVGYDQNIAAVDVQNRVAVALPQLPEEVQRTGVTVRRVSTDLTIVVNLISPDGSRDDVYLSNYAAINISRPAEAAGRRGRHQPVRRAALLDARLARPGQARDALASRRRT